MSADDLGLPMLAGVETLWQELARPRRDRALLAMGELEREPGVAKAWRLRILCLGFMGTRRRLVTVVAGVGVVVFVVVVRVDEEETSSGSTVVAGETSEAAVVAEDFVISSRSFSVEMRRDTAQRCMCRLDRIAFAALLLIDADRRLSAEGVRFAKV